MEMKKIKLRKKMINHVRVYNRLLTKNYLNQFSLKRLLSFCHPEDRDNFAYEIKKTEA